MTEIQNEGALPRTIFPYRSLDERDSIRLLHLHPASSSQAEVKCSLVQTTLQFCGDIYEHYIAISYVWGDPNDTRTIHVDDIPVSITINLFSALRDLRHETRALLVWADAICINQHDEEEKLKQIAMMGEIYSMADHTVIYLGCLDTQDALKLDSWASANFEPSHFSPGIADLILSSPWFRRVWVFQELVFSKDPKVQLGRYRLPWRFLYRIVVAQMRSKDSALNTEGLLQNFELLSEMHRARERHLRDEGLRSEAWGSEPTHDDAEKTPGLMMLDLLRARRGLGVTHPKDMIFAHLGFASDSLDLTTGINYSMDHNVVYNAFARYTIDQGRHRELFDAISSADHSTIRNGLSSWSPDWSIASNHLCFPRSDWCLEVFHYKSTFNEIFLPKSLLSSKKTDSLERRVMSANKRSLRWKNIQKDVHYTFVGYPPILACLGAELDVVVRCSGSLLKLVELYLHNLSIGKCCWRTALDNLTSDRRYRSFGLRSQCGNESHPAGVKTIKEILESLMEDDVTFDILTANSFYIHRAFKETVGGNGTTSNSHGTLALMSSGKLALVPESTQPGDLVAGLLLPSFTESANSYLVLRPRAAEVHDLEASLTEIFCQRIRPILQCSIVGCCWLQPSRYVYRDESTPEYRSEVSKGCASSYDTPWKRVMAGSTIKGSLGEGLNEFLHEYVPKSLPESPHASPHESLDKSSDGSLDKSLDESLDGSDGSLIYSEFGFWRRRRVITWKTFAIH
jgi:hypothetical protein